MAVPELLCPQYLLTPPLTLCARGLKPVEKLVKDRLIKGEMARESHMIKAMVCGHVYKEIWCAAIGEDLSCIRGEVIIAIRLL